jgi:NAD(P)H-hydrate epimerase
MIGVGGTEDLKGRVVDLLEAISDSDVIKIAIDSPTGLNTETGFAHENAFLADLTVTMYAEKIGMYLNEGPKVCGEIVTAELGAPASIIQDISRNSILDLEDISALMPLRKKVSSKFDYGKSLIIAGSRDMPGAAALVPNACIVAGSGLVYLLTPNVHHSLYPEIIPFNVSPSDIGGFSLQSLELADKLADSCNSIAIGPGMGDSEEAIEFAHKIIYKYMHSKKIIVDGDGIKAIDPKARLSNNVVLTPHTGEFSRLTGIIRDEIERFPNKYAIEWSEKLNCVIHLKAHPSVTAFSGKAVINPYGNPGMATAGSGDVLTGFITALSAQGLNVFESAALGSFLHSKCGDKFIKSNPALTLRATDLIDSLKNILPAGY